VSTPSFFLKAYLTRLVAVPPVHRDFLSAVASDQLPEAGVHTPTAVVKFVSAVARSADGLAATNAVVTPAVPGLPASTTVVEEAVAVALPFQLVMAKFKVASVDVSSVASSVTCAVASVTALVAPLVASPRIALARSSADCALLTTFS